MMFIILFGVSCIIAEFAATVLTISFMLHRTYTIDVWQFAVVIVMYSIVSASTAYGTFRAARSHYR